MECGASLNVLQPNSERVLGNSGLQFSRAVKQFITPTSLHYQRGVHKPSASDPSQQ